MSGALNLTELREGGTQDLGEVNRIMQDSFDPRFGEAWTSAQCLGMLALPGVWLVVASLDGEDAGFALARAIGDEAELLLLATRPDARRRGIAGALLRAIVAEARARGVVQLHLEVRAGNDAVRLYRREGFEKVGERRNYYRGKMGQAFDAHTYARKLG
ncbi:ribosomal-protein-alanine N-acetyltransferase [Sphingomonas naasensis]|uniref:GNAT family N-acetyltransferase n=1 Tax=Sphingomonas naasensis TaxID=1344951 RepID=A0A4S1W5Q0_9SPHN|nr:GNAT family N-acetyltransferase [Sphingomonas naasensis]NIJ19988.1 ribosomal-protein-alanine N-acetyltransferase [Sphingomonas naasensis]TGX37938.1 GNAT family N-acetyltransferase [Sphingomonas naasensis]